MKVKDFSYKGFKFEVHFAESGDWGDKIHNFYTKCEHNFDGGFAKTLEKVLETIHKQINDFLKNQPKTLDELVDRIESDCFVWAGYEDCQLDRVSAKLLIESYISNKVK